MPGVVLHVAQGRADALAQQGQPAFRDRFELAWRHRASQPNALWQADHTELDVLVLEANGTAARPWLTTVIDDHSRAIAGYTVFLGAPSALHTSLALRQAIWRKTDPAWPVCGIPDVLHVDHGSDFTSTHLGQAAADLRIELVYSAVGRPQGRGKVERLFGTLNTELLPELPGYLVRGKPATRPRPTTVHGRSEQRGIRGAGDGSQVNGDCCVRTIRRVMSSPSLPAEASSQAS